ncbi:PLDc N-terminal domain-containing protein [Candidatus Woesearchaeota archaeon]|nr:PLDc N-terminal domain-containing protein [Candidatus Woesearchaeota archaeon]
MRKVLLPILALILSICIINSVLGLGPAEAGAILVLSFVGILVFWFLIFVVLFAGVIFWLWMFIDCLVREDYRHPNDKIVWVIVLLFTSVIGAVLYYFFVRRRLNKSGGRKRALIRAGRPKVLRKRK